MGFEIVVKVMINTSYEVFQYILQIIIKNDNVAKTGVLMVEMFEKLCNPLMMFCSKLREATVIV